MIVIPEIVLILVGVFFMYKGQSTACRLNSFKKGFIIAVVGYAAIVAATCLQYTRLL